MNKFRDPNILINFYNLYLKDRDNKFFSFPNTLTTDLSSFFDFTTLNLYV